MNAGIHQTGQNAMHFPALGLGIFPTWPEALAVIGIPEAERAAWLAEHGGRCTLLTVGGDETMQVLIRPADDGAARVDYLFGCGFADSGAARIEAERCAATGWPEPGEAWRWHVVTRRGATH